ncbi:MULTISPECIES: Hsp20/alpha crystallin family protein [Chryseobacterium]|uniref:HSP20 family protein n=1 Tax=Chryseobacterium camelliae TaxID=1265445 RepID=A0ABU0TES5_9FLAO|nr:MULTISPECIES: Hsp20/alpha crystallin family protein [Chryseobacterium]MDT3406644.1 HSP20 family protein [Pseudacidovorax intermedius]MDQ1095559.1 HSP20 family protein [Chryseobacterium camelliae]MDQ1099496.1 HSP20 family protein [Chryseobacterium sp. SORGH_AS_1048]MDR6086843.1 HSP20 family protein [Chryseobacterium sp. SORGH_AS_0909]MDR6131214.1 HSP20 family protein [Chryseobacterium sp. SORGH_AS_1175]
MSIVKRNNGSMLPAAPRALFDDFFGRELFNWGNNNFSSTMTTVPSVNIRENTENFEVEVAAPGMDKKDFQITLEGNMLTISSSRKNESEENKDQYTRREFSYQSFTRTFELAKDVVDEEHIEAKYDNGVLKLTIPKTEKAKKQAPRLIEIQ